MIRILIFFILFAPVSCLAQISITGRVLNQADTKPVANTSVFFSNATIGGKTATDGTFTLRNIKPGKYDLVISIIGFETFTQTIIVANSNIVIPDITIFPKTTLLNEVKIKPHTDPNHEKYYQWFKEEFLGTSETAKECEILNPDVLDLAYDEETGTLTASSYDFLEIRNPVLGYKIKYLLTDFKLENKDETKKKIYYKGPVLYEELKGSPLQQKRWSKNRQQAYEGSAMHFLRSVIGNNFKEQGFRVWKLSVFNNAHRQPDSVINGRIQFYKDLPKGAYHQEDSLAYWVKKSRLPKKFQKLLHTDLKDNDFVVRSHQGFPFALTCTGGALYVTYDKDKHFRTNDMTGYLDAANNTDNSLINFNTPYANFYDNGALADPYSLLYNGVWGRQRVAERLPIDYVEQMNTDISSDNGSNNAVSKLKQFSTDHPIEKAYLHFDKPHYAAGDTIYFKVYVISGDLHELSTESGVLHVDLINTGNKINQSIKLQLINGIAWGDFALPDSLPKGNYRIRAYTRLMQSFGDTWFFDQPIPIGSYKSSPAQSIIINQPINAQKPKADLQFFPEGGQLTTDVRSKVAFKFTGVNGLGEDVRGVIIDNDNNQITAFSSGHLGMGYFYLEPKAGITYKAKFTYADGEQGLLDLPATGNSGINLSVDNNSTRELSVQVAVNKAYYQDNKGKEYYLLLYSGGAATTIDLKLDSEAVTVGIQKRRFHSGVLQVTLFSKTSEPLCERLVFIQNPDLLKLSLETAKTYAKRGKVTVNLSAKDRYDSPAAGTFSVSVTDEGKVPVDEPSENTILTNLLLTSDLKGYVEQPNYYFSNMSDSTTRANLDILMLTQGYRRFVWKQLLTQKDSIVNYQPEKALEISGTVKSLLGKPIAKGSVSLILPSGPLLSEVSDKEGAFHFQNLVFMDTAHFVLQATNAKGKNSTTISYHRDDEPHVANKYIPGISDIINTGMATYLHNSKLLQQQITNYGPPKGIMLKEVNIKNKKVDDKYQTQSLVGAGNADQVLHAKDFHGGGELSDQLNGKLHGITFIKGHAFLTTSTMDVIAGNGAKPMLVIVDGAEIPPDPPMANSAGGANINNINLNDVETVEVLTSGQSAIYGMNAAGGVLIITTKQGSGKDLSDIASVGILPITVNGFYKAREFYSPQYGRPVTTKGYADLRTTIFWKPNVVTDKDGNASFEFYNSDGPGSYRVVVEGIDVNGNLGRQVYRYKVE